MAIAGVNNYNHYNNTYENSYSGKTQDAAKTEGTKESTAAGTAAEKKASYEDYLRVLQRNFPGMQFQLGYGISAKNEGNKNPYMLSVDPKLIEKMQSDPEAEKEYMQRIRDIKAAMDWTASYYKARGGTTYYEWVNNYIDENGKFYHSCLVIHKDEVNEKLRKKAEENAKKLIETTRENTKKKKEALKESMEFKAKELYDEEKKQEENVRMNSEKSDREKRAWQMMDDKLEESEDGKVFLYNSDVETIIEATKERVDEKIADKLTDKSIVGTNLDQKI